MSRAKALNPYKAMATASPMLQLPAAPDVQRYSLSSSNNKF